MKFQANIWTTSLEIEIPDFELQKHPELNTDQLFQTIKKYLQQIDMLFNTFNPDSVISRINRKEIQVNEAGSEVASLLRLGEIYREKTEGYFEIIRNGQILPLGIVKAIAIDHICKILQGKGIHNFLVNIGGDIQTFGKESEVEFWTIGIADPSNSDNNLLQVVLPENFAIATSGSIKRGNHIYNPKNLFQPETTWLSVTVIADNILDADVFATTLFAMGKYGPEFSKKLNIDAFFIDHNHTQIFTCDFTLNIKQ